MTDWKNRGGQTHASVQLPPLDLNKEHIFELVSIDFQDGVTETYEGKTQTVNKCKMVWKEADKESEYHRVWVTANEFYSEKSNLMKFLVSASGKPFVAGVDVKLGDYLTDHHRIRARVTARIKKDTGEPNGYYDFIKASIRPADQQPQITLPTNNAPKTDEKALSLANAKLIVKGCANRSEAILKLYEAKVTVDILDAFKAADDAKQIIYPI